MNKNECWVRTAENTQLPVYFFKTWMWNMNNEVSIVHVSAFLIGYVRPED